METYHEMYHAVGKLVTFTFTKVITRQKTDCPFELKEKCNKHKILEPTFQ